MSNSLHALLNLVVFKNNVSFLTKHIIITFPFEQNKTLYNTMAKYINNAIGFFLTKNIFKYHSNLTPKNC